MKILESPANFIASNIRNFYQHSTVFLRRKPDYMIIGAQKSGTTTLFDTLSQHPSINNPKNKEMHYFDDRDIHSRNQYRSKFPISYRRLTGEATPIYIYYPGVPQRIRSMFPDCKFVVILRNPIGRAYSHYQMRVRRGKEDLSFEEALEAEESRLEEAHTQYKNNPEIHNSGLLSHSYRDRGVYCKQLERWWSVFPPSQFHVMSYENFINNPSDEYGELCDFLGISRCEDIKLGQPNVAKYPQISDSAYANLEMYYAEYNAKLFKMLGKTFPWG